MSIWMGSLRLPDPGFRLIEPSSGSSFTLKAIETGEWELTANELVDATREPLVRGTLHISPSGFKVEGKDAFIKLTPVTPGQQRGQQTTGPGDLLLELRAYNQLGQLAFQIEADKIVAPPGGLQLQVLGPRASPDSTSTGR